MRLRTLFASVGLLVMGVSALGQATYGFSPDPVVGLPVDFDVPFAIFVHGDPAWTQPKWGNMTFNFQVDTSMVDLVFYDGVNELLLSSVGTAQVALTAAGMLSSTLTGTPAGTAKQLSGNIRQVQLGIAPGSALPNVDSNDTFRAGDGSPLRWRVHGAAIAGAGGMYNLVMGATNLNIIRNGTNPSGAGATNKPLTMVGGKFTIVPEPGAIFAFATGLGSLVALRRRKA